MPLILIALLPFLGAVLPALTIRFGRNVCAASAGLVTLLAFAGLLSHAPAVMAGEVIFYRLDWIPILGLNAHFMLDGLGLLFAGLILGIGLLIILYARFYLDSADPMGRFYCFLLLFQGAMTGIVLSDNVLLLLIFWELTSLSSFLLIGYWSHLPEGRQGARMALAVTGMGGLAMIAGMLILGGIAGSYDLSVILQHGSQIQDSPLYLTALILILLGAFTKSAQFPFHFWLPHAMAAPTPVSAYLHSATMVKAGIFLMARLWPVLSGTPEWFYIVATTGLITMLLGAAIALFKDDLKALLAYSTVSHLGLITMLLGFGTPFAAVAAVFHIINHATFKAALFMTAGIIDHGTGTRSINRLGGLRRLMPITFAIGTIAALSMAGLPLLNVFLSKEMMLEEAAHTVWWANPWLVPVLVTVGSLLSATYSYRFIIAVFFGTERHDYPHHPHDPERGLWVGPAFLAALVILIGILPVAMAGGLVAIAASSVTGGMLPDYTLKIWHGLTPALGMSVIALIGGAVALFCYPALVRLWDRLPNLSAKAIFDNLIADVIRGSAWLTNRVHNGAMTRYAAMFVVTVLIACLQAWFSGTAGPATRTLTAASPLVVAGWFVLVAATIAVVVLHRQRAVALVLVGVIGLFVSVTFVLFSAPDLALTQSTVEVVTIILLLLALNFLPNLTPREGSTSRHIRDAVLAIGAGLGAALLTYVIQVTDFSAESISAYHLANAKTLGGGTNVVNVILVDFRGFDTYGEIIVLGIAAIVIYALTEALLASPVGAQLAARGQDQGESRDSHPLLMVVVTRVLMPIAIMIGMFIFLRGHNQPGGGFIAGLIVSIALLMQYMASGFGWAVARQRFPYHSSIGLGIMAASITGIGAFAFGHPFLTSTFGYVVFPPIEKFELASAMAFDLGVFLCVLGAVMLALESLSRLAARRSDKPILYPMDIDPSRGKGS